MCIAQWKYGYSHNGRDEDGRSRPLQENIGEGFKDGVRNVEDGQAVVEIASRHVNVIQKTGDFGISNVGPIEEADKVEEAKLGIVS